MKPTIYIMRHSIPERLLDRDYFEDDFDTLNHIVGLSIEGEERAKEVTDCIPNVDVVISSDYARTIGTAKYVAEKYGRKLKITKLFGERVFGVKKRDDIPDDFWEKQDKDHDFKLPQGESFNETKERMYNCLMKTIQENIGKVIFVVSHGSATEMLFDRFCETKIVENEKKIYFNDKLVYENDIEVLDLFKMEFEDDELVELIKI